MNLPPTPRPAFLAVALVLVACGQQTVDVPSPTVETPPAGSPGVSSVAPSPSVVATGPAATPEATEQPGGKIEIAWTEAAADGRITAVAVDGDRLVAAGSQDGAFAAWTSQDGLAWEMVEVPTPDAIPDEEESEGLPPNFEAGASRMGRLVRLGDTLYSFGLFNFMDFVRPVGWRWTDGGPWAYIASDSAFYEAGAVSDVVAGNDQLVAARHEVALSWQGADSTVWTWTPDNSWEVTDLSQADPERVYVTELAWDGATYLASGLISTPGVEDPAVGGATAAVWASADGRTWRKVEPPASSLDICALEAAPGGGFLAMGHDPNGVAVWQLAGGSWTETRLITRVIDGPDIGGPIYRPCTIVNLDERALAFYQDDDGVRFWSTIDGSSWEPGGEPVAAKGVHIGGGGDTVVIVTSADFANEGAQTIHVGRVTVSP